MKNYKLIIAYDGSRFHGWEKKEGQDTVQGRIENVLRRMSGDQEVCLVGAGRTDAGVHAKAMAASVRLDCKMTEEEIKDYLNTYLPEDIGVKEVKEASERFHARYCAVGKTYRYTCYAGRVNTVFDRKYYSKLESMPDIERMERAAKFLIGRHDFKGFSNVGKTKKSTVRIVDKAEIKRKGDYLYFTFHGRGFLRNMVRIMAGTLLQVGFGEKEPEEIKEILEKRDRALAGPAAPAKGLCLIEVEY